MAVLLACGGGSGSSEKISTMTLLQIGDNKTTDRKIWAYGAAQRTRSPKKFVKAISTHYPLVTLEHEDRMYQILKWPSNV